MELDLKSFIIKIALNLTPKGLKNRAFHPRDLQFSKFYSKSNVTKSDLVRKLRTMLVFPEDFNKNVKF